jgi:hypothetical protein
MVTPPTPDDLRTMREALHRLLDWLPPAALVALWRFV